MEKFESKLAKWPGFFTLPDYDDFDGEMWETWNKIQVDTPNTQINRFYCYAGLKLIEAIGEWHFDIPLTEIAGWQNDKKAERIRFVSWIGKQVNNYHLAIVDPKG